MHTTTNRLLLSLWLLFCFYISILKAILYYDYNECLFTFTDNYGINVTYNLSKFHVRGEAFQVDDYDVEDFRYEFQICGRISRRYWNLSIPQYCYWEDLSKSAYAPSYGRPCVNISNGVCHEYYNINNTRPSAIQINEGKKKCYWLGMEIDHSYNMKNYSIALYDSDDGARGVSYTILNGGYCSTSTTKQNRQLVIEFLCPDSAKETFTPQVEAQSILNESVVEYPDCVYTLTYTSPLACPAQCISINSSANEYSVCNGKGICTSDPVAKTVKCLCDDGWTGDTCTTVSSSLIIIQHKQSSLLTAIIICIVLLSLALVVVLFLCYRIRQREENLRARQKDYIQPLTDNNANANTNNNIVENVHDEDAPQMNKRDIQLNSIDPSIQNELTSNQ